MKQQLLRCFLVVACLCAVTLSLSKAAETQEEDSGADQDQPATDEAATNEETPPEKDEVPADREEALEEPAPDTKPAETAPVTAAVKESPKPTQIPTPTGPACPTTFVPATLYVHHNITQDYQGNKTSSLVSGTIDISIGSDVVKSVGTSTIKVNITGSFPEAQCTMQGSRDLIVTVKGTCDTGMLTLNLSEVYQAGLQTMTCPGTTQKYPTPANTVSHTIKLSAKNGATYTKPFAGQNGSGTYSWSLKM